MATLGITVNVPDNMVQEMIDSIDARDPKADGEPRDAAEATAWIKDQVINLLKRTHKKHKAQIAIAAADLGST